MKASGIGGVIFKAKDPEVLASWYKKNLGIDRNKWEQTAGATAFAPTSADSDYFNKSQRVSPDCSLVFSKIFPSRPTTPTGVGVKVRQAPHGNPKIVLKQYSF